MFNNTAREGIYFAPDDTIAGGKEERSNQPERISNEESTRRKIVGFLPYFKEKADLFQGYLEASPEQKLEGYLTSIDSRAIKALYGAGLPLEYIFHDFSGNTGHMTYFLAPHHFFTPLGFTFVDLLKENEKAAAIAREMVELYNRNIRRIIAKSSLLQRILDILDRGRNTELSAEEIKLVKQAGLSDYKFSQEPNYSHFLDAVEPSFGDHFQKAVILGETPENFRTYRTEMEQLIDKLLEELMAENNV